MAKKQFLDLQEFINYLDAIGDLKRVKTEVDSDLEASEIADRLSCSKT
jgi:UbiD family decarboxylase